jgi:hypothetical protein
MQAVQVSAIAALIMVAGHAGGQTTSQPTYYPQCWFWQLPTNDDAVLVKNENAKAHLSRRFIPLINIYTDTSTSPQQAVTQGIARINHASSLGLFYPDKLGFMPQNFKQESNGPLEGRLISESDMIDFDTDSTLPNGDPNPYGDPDPDYPQPWDVPPTTAAAIRAFNVFEKKNPFLTDGIGDAYAWNLEFAQLWRDNPTFITLANGDLIELPVPVRICLDNEDALTNTGPNLYPFALVCSANEDTLPGVTGQVPITQNRFHTYGIAGFPGGSATVGVLGHKTLKQMWDEARGGTLGGDNFGATFAAQHVGTPFASANPWLSELPAPIVNLSNNDPRAWQDWTDGSGQSALVPNQEVGIWYMKLNQRIKDGAKKLSTYDIWTWAFRDDTGVVFNPQPYAKISNYGDFDCKPGVQDFGWHYDGKINGNPGALVRTNDRGQYDTFAHYAGREKRSSGRWFLRDDYRASSDFSSPVLYVANVAAGFETRAQQNNPYLPPSHPDYQEDRWDASLREHRQTLESIITSCMTTPGLVSTLDMSAPWKTISPWIVPEGVNWVEDENDVVRLLERDESRRQLSLLRSKAISDLQIFNPGSGTGNGPGQWEDNRSDHYPDFIHVYRQVFEPQLRWRGAPAPNYPLFPRHGLFEPATFGAGATVWDLAGNGISNRPSIENVLDTNPRLVSTNPVVMQPLYASVHESGIGGGNVFNASPTTRNAGFFVEANLREADLSVLPNQSYRINIEAEVELIAAPTLTRAQFEAALATPLVPCGFNIDLRGVLELRKSGSSALYRLRFDEHPSDPWVFAVPLDAPQGFGQTGRQSLVRILGTQGNVADPLRASVSVRREFTLPGCVSVSPNATMSIGEFINSATSGADFAVSFQWRPGVAGTTSYPNSLMRVRYDLIQVSRIDAPVGCPVPGGGGGGGEEPMMAAMQVPSADVDRSGDVTMEDADIFFAAFQYGGGEADQNVDGEISPQDIVEFLESFSGEPE